MNRTMYPDTYHEPEQGYEPTDQDLQDWTEHLASLEAESAEAAQ